MSLGGESVVARAATVAALVVASANGALLAEGDLFGLAICAVGDLDRYGVCDIAVGAPWAHVDAPRASGTASVLSGRDGRALFVWRAPEGRRGYGGGIAGGCDVDGDGVPEIVVGNWGSRPGEGTIDLRSGRDGTVLRAVVASATESSFGRAIVFVGDGDGDHVRDLAVFAENGEPRIVIVSARSGERLRTLAIGRDTGSLTDRFAILPDSIGRTSDTLLAVVAPPDRRSLARIAALSVSTGELAWSHRFRMGACSRREPLGVGDFDGDGRVDFVHVAAASDGSSRLAFVTAATQHEYASLDGFAELDDVELVSIGDMDADGATDLACSRQAFFGEASLSVISGRSRRTLLDWGRDAEWIEQHHAGRSIAAPGDLDGDRVPDLVFSDVDEDSPAVPGVVEARSGRSGTLLW